MNNLITTDRHPRLVLAELRELQAAGHAIQVCFGAGVDSTAMLIALKDAGITPELILFADTGGEKPETYDHAHAMDEYLVSWGFPTVTWVKQNTTAKMGYNDLAGKCLDNETLPSLAFGGKSCSIWSKQNPQDNFIKGVNAEYVGKELPAHLANCNAVHPLWTRSQETGRKIIKLIGYDSGKADIRRSSKLKTDDNDFMFVYPLQLLGWERADCIRVIQDAGLPVPIKSACYFCPASQEWEMWWLAGTHPELFEKALRIEIGAMLGKHSRFVVGTDGEIRDEKGLVIEFGETWDEMVRDRESFPSSKTTVGLGRKVSWTQFGIVNGIIDKDTFLVDREHLDFFVEMADELRGSADNALDRRTCGGGIAA